MAYRRLETLRRQSCKSWDKIVADPASAQNSTTTALASRLLPVPLHRITTRVASARGAGLADAVRVVAEQIDLQGELVRVIEDALAQRSAPDRQAIELGARLHNPLIPALWGSAYYLPRRVTDLSPTRVADLLNERNLTK